MYAEIKNYIYDKLLGNKDKKTAILWSGGPYSTLVWWIAYKELNLRLPVIFVDTGDLPPSLYGHVAAMKQKNDLELEIKQGKIEDVIKSGEYDVYLTGRPLEGAIAVVPDSRESWNYLKSLPMTFFGGIKRILK